jgi:uncharacterized protein YpbB
LLKGGECLSYFDKIILHCLKSLNGERTIYSIYHLLKGKKTSQTIQDAYLFQLTPYFGVYSSITREALEVVINQQNKQQWIISYGDQRFGLTKAGGDYLLLLQNHFPALIYLNGLKFHQKDLLFWQRLSLLVQVVSNLVNKETNYIPIQKNKETHRWVKSFLLKSNLERNQLGKKLYGELVECLQIDHCLDPSILILRLTGFKRIGQTSQQIAEMRNMSAEQYQLEFLNILHYLIEQISTNKNRFPLLNSILENTNQNIVMTNSSNKTYELLKRGYSIEKIAEYRGLKISTIEDHIVEIALNMNDFSIDHLVDQQKQERILKAAKKTASKQLKLIRNEVSSANYFEIRLVLAKHGVKQWN